MAESSPTEDQNGVCPSKQYFQDLEKWVQDIYAWQHCQAGRMQNIISTSPISLSFNPAAGRTLFNMNNGNGEVRGMECHLAPLWKRMVAECIDFVILFLLKVLAAVILIDMLNVIEWDKYDVEGIVKRSFKFDWSVSEVTTEILIVESMHRVIVCAYEIYFLRSGQQGTVGGATPGKRLLKIRVVRCELVTLQHPHLSHTRALIQPGGNLGLGRAVTRSVIKNFILPLCIPFTLVLIFFYHNRTGYDLLSQSVVVEDTRRPRNRRFRAF